MENSVSKSTRIGSGRGQLRYNSLFFTFLLFVHSEARRRGLVVKVEDSCPRGPGFKS